MVSHTSDPTTPILGTNGWRLHGTRIEEGARCAIHAGGAEQLTRNDTAGVHRHPERATADLASQRKKETVAGPGDAPADDDDVGIEGVQQVGDAGAKNLGRVRDYFLGDGITLGR